MEPGGLRIAVHQLYLLAEVIPGITWKADVRFESELDGAPGR